MPQVFIPPLLRPLVEGADVVDIEAGSLREILEKLETRFPGVKARLCEEDDLKPGLSVAIDGHLSNVGLSQKVGPNSEVHFLPAIGGG